MQFTILGASGLAGRSLCEVASLRGLPVRAVARSDFASTGAPFAFVRVADYADAPPPRDADDILIHLAQTSTAGASHDVQAAVDLTERILRLGYRKTCYASSAAVYGDRHRHPHPTTDIAGTPSAYAALKLACEEPVIAAGGLVVRFTNLYGHGQSKNSVLWRIVSQLRCSGPMRLQSLTPVRDFCWVEDAAAAIVELCAADARGEFNVGSGAGICIGDLARLALAVAGEQDREIIADQVDPGAESVLLVDISQTINESGWRPRTGWRDGLRQLVERRI